MTFNVDIAAIIIIGLIIVFGILQRFDEAAQTTALKRMADIEEDEYFMLVREKREEKSSVTPDFNEWLKELTDLRIISHESVSYKPKALTFIATRVVDVENNEKGDQSFRLVVSPLAPGELKKEAAIVEKSRFGGQPLLGYKKLFRSTPSFERSIRNAGEFFDIYAGKLGEAYGLNWGQPGRLYFYIVT